MSPRPSPPSVPQTLAARPAPPALPLARGCVIGFGVSLLTLLAPGSAGAQTDLTGTITHDGIARDYRLHLPPRDVGPDALPLVLNLHGYTSNAREQEAYSGMNAVADTAGFAACYPDGVANQWNVGWVFNRDTDDVGFLAALVDTLVARHGLDRDRVYACGMSNGGFMSYVLACEAPGVVAAAGSVTGGMVPGRRRVCAPDPAVPAIQIHGTADPTVPYFGSLINDSIPATVAFWAALAGCDPDPATEAVPDRAADGFTTERLVYADCDGVGVEVDGAGAATVELWTVEGGGHTWPGAAIAIGPTTADFSASEELWRFFRRYALRRASGSGAGVAPEVLPEGRALGLAPNPAAAGSTVTLTPATHDRVLEVRDLAGRYARRIAVPAGSAALTLTGLPAGAYAVGVVGGARAERLVVR